MQMPRGKPGTKAPHGTLTRYIAHGCRCDKCRAANTERSHKRRLTNPERERALSLAWKDRNREANRERDRKYYRTKRDGTYKSKQESPFERELRNDPS